jgi:asparagine synthase (glutamine-hydrolysing)
MFCANGFFLAKIDVGAFPESAFVTGRADDVPWTVATVAGHPFLAESRERSTSRQRHLELICAELDRGRTDVLRDCLGPFAICYCRLPRGPLILATDRVGNRPLYYHVGKEYVFFSNALRVLEALPEVPKRMDGQGIAESLAIGFPLGDRTPYADIKVLENGQYLACEDGAVRLGSYFQWDQIAPTSLTVEELLDRSYDLFVSAVARRSAGQSKVVSNLSGGLDSRCIVTALHSLKKEVYVVTWATDGYLDGRLAGEYAKALGLKQSVRPIPAVPSWGDLFRCLRDLSWPGTNGPPHPNLVFSGDGGSVGVGYDYLNAERIGWMRAGHVETFVDFFLARHTLPGRFMRESAYRRMREALYDGVKSEITRIHSFDAGRDLHIFYLKNDQRRHLYPLYENIDLCRVEYLLPFYDGQFLELLESAPVDDFLQHDFYHQWLTRFPPVIMSVPWQTYRGHLPCPVKMRVSGRTQWEKRRTDWFAGKNREAFWRCAWDLVRRDFPSCLLNRPRLWAAWILHALRMRPYGYLFEACVKCRHYSSRSTGELVFPQGVSGAAFDGLGSSTMASSQSALEPRD